MKFTKNWLLDYLIPNCTFEEILKGLESLGLEVERVVDYIELLKEFAVAEILETRLHEQADKLKICTLNTTKGVKEIVCGAPNVRPNLKVIFANTGTYIPGSGVTLKEIAIRGFKSDGMMVSEYELGLSNEHTKVVEVPQHFNVGDPASLAVGFHDTLIEVAVTPNLGHLLSVRAIAKSLAALNLGVFKDPEEQNVLQNIWTRNHSHQDAVWQYYSSYADFVEHRAKHNTHTSPVDITLNPNICSNFIAVKMNQLDITGSLPPFIANRLQLIGQPLINPIVDIINYLTVDLNHPMHAYNLKTLGSDLIVDFGNVHDSILALDNKTYTQLEDIAVVKSHNQVIAIAGVIGGTNYSVEENTTDILIECAYFNPYEITKTVNRLGINTTSSYHFQRGVNPADLMTAVNKAASLLNQVCNGSVTEVYMSYNAEARYKTISTTTEYINNLLGTTLSDNMITELLGKQDLQTTLHNGILSVTVPSYRNDIEVDSDIAEVVMKSFGIDNITPTTIQNINVNADDNSKQNSNYSIAVTTKHTMAALGFVECINMSFISESLAKLFEIYDENLKLSNPINQDLAVMRKSLIPSLALNVSHNSRAGYNDLTFFEVANTYSNLDSVTLNVAAILNGVKHKKDWRFQSTPYDTYDIKEAMFNLIENLGVNGNKFKVDAQSLPSYYHPGTSGTLWMGNHILGHFGTLHPRLTRYFNLKTSPAFFELVIERLPLPRIKLPLSINTLPNQMPLERDFAFIIDKSIPALDIVKIVSNINKKLITEVRIFDVYNISDSKKSIAFAVTFSPTNSSLTEKDISHISLSIINAITTKLNGVLRDKILNI